MAMVDCYGDGCWYRLVVILVMSGNGGGHG